MLESLCELKNHAAELENEIDKFKSDADVNKAYNEGDAETDVEVKEKEFHEQINR